MSSKNDIDDDNGVSIIQMRKLSFREVKLFTQLFKSSTAAQLPTQILVTLNNNNFILTNDFVCEGLGPGFARWFFCSIWH